MSFLGAPLASTPVTSASLCYQMDTSAQSSRDADSRAQRTSDSASALLRPSPAQLKDELYDSYDIMDSLEMPPPCTPPTEHNSYDIIGLCGASCQCHELHQQESVTSSGDTAYDVMVGLEEQEIALQQLRAGIDSTLKRGLQRLHDVIARQRLHLVRDASLHVPPGGVTSRSASRSRVISCLLPRTSSPMRGKGDSHTLVHRRTIQSTKVTGFADLGLFSAADCPGRE